MRRDSIAPGEFYHIYNRGTEKRTIFMNDKGYERFLALLYACNSRKAVDLKLQGSTLYEVLGLDGGGAVVDVGAYCLMPNHFHLLIKSKNEGDVSKFMQKVSTGYTMYFNTREERTGALFQGRFKARHVPTDTYLRYLIAYIHLNPVKLIEPAWKETGISDRQKAVDYLRTYRWSSYLDYLGEKRGENVLLNKSALPEYWSTKKSFEEFVTDWLERGMLSSSSIQMPPTQKESAKSLV